MGSFQGRVEEIDYSSDVVEAREMAGEYRIAFGENWRIWVEKEIAVPTI